jgi:hypothetical protein
MSGPTVKSLVSDVDWGHVALLAVILAMIISRVKTRHMRRFKMTLSINRDALDTASTEKQNVTQQQHDPDES